MSRVCSGCSLERAESEFPKRTLADDIYDLVLAQHDQRKRIATDGACEIQPGCATITGESLGDAMRQVWAQSDDLLREDARRSVALVESIPPHLRDTREAAHFVAAVTFSWSNPFNPADAEKIQDWWRQFVESHPAPPAVQ
jgi:hypothetical protein